MKVSDHSGAGDPGDDERVVGFLWARLQVRDSRVRDQDSGGHSDLLQVTTPEVVNGAWRTHFDLWS
jgi:hypothetical protein